MNVMNRYQGPAVVGIGSDDPDVPVTATLTATSSGSLSGWSGAVRAKSDNDQTRLLNLAQGRIQLPNGQTSTFVATNMTATFTFEIMGDDGTPPPF